MYIVYIMERSLLALKCTSIKAIKFLKIKICLQKGALRLKIDFMTIDALVSSNLHFHPLL